MFNLWQLELERLGYVNFAQVLNSKDYGVPQNRERIFLVSIRADELETLAGGTFYFPNPFPLERRLKDVLEKQGEQKPVKTAKEAWKEMRLEVYAQASGNRHEPNCSDDSSKIFSLNDIDEIFEKVSDSVIEQRPHWEPSDKQIEALESATANCAYSEYQDCLTDLIRQLKAL